MKKLLGSVIIMLSLFFSTNGMNDQDMDIEYTDSCVIEINELTKSKLFQAIQDRDLDKVYTTIECADNDFFESLSTVDSYWLLLTTLNRYIDHSHSDLTYRNTLLDNMYTMVGYNSREYFWKEHFVEQLININLHEVIDCAVAFGLENIMHLVVKALLKNKELAQKCISIPYQSLAPLHTAIKYGHIGIVKIILEDFIPLMLETDQNARHLWDFIGREFLFAACVEQIHSEYGAIVHSFLKNNLVASHLSNSDLSYVYNSINNTEYKTLIEALIETRESRDKFSNNQNQDYPTSIETIATSNSSRNDGDNNYFYGFFSYLFLGT